MCAGRKAHEYGETSSVKTSNCKQEDPSENKTIVQGFMDVYLRLEKAHVPGDLPVWFLVLQAKSFVEDSDSQIKPSQE